MSHASCIYFCTSYPQHFRQALMGKQGFLYVESCCQSKRTGQSRGRRSRCVFNELGQLLPDLTLIPHIHGSSWELISQALQKPKSDWNPGVVDEGLHNSLKYHFPTPKMAPGMLFATWRGCTCAVGFICSSPRANIQGASHVQKMTWGKAPLQSSGPCLNEAPTAFGEIVSIVLPTSNPLLFDQRQHSTKPYERFSIFPGRASLVQ